MINIGALVAMMLLAIMQPTTAAAADPPKDGQFNDAFLENLVGDWNVQRTFPSGRTAQNTVHARWVLNHQWLVLDYHDVASPPKYQATVFIGYDAGKKRY